MSGDNPKEIIDPTKPEAIEGDCWLISLVVQRVEAIQGDTEHVRTCEKYTRKSLQTVMLPTNVGKQSSTMIERTRRKQLYSAIDEAKALVMSDDYNERNSPLFDG